LVKHFAQMGIFVSARRILTGWDGANKKPAKGGFGRIPKYSNWMESDRRKPDTWYTTFVDLYAFPKDPGSRYSKTIQEIGDPYLKIEMLEHAIGLDINRDTFIPYVQLNEFEAFLWVEPDRLLGRHVP
jgi:Domain of unknown function (DUF4276)